MVIGRLPNVVITTSTGLLSTTAAVISECIMASLYDVGVWGDVRAGVTITVVTEIGVGVFTLPDLVEESKLFC